MQELEKILEEIEDLQDISGWDLLTVQGILEIIRKHMNDGWISVDKNNVPDHEILACDRYGEELIGYLSYDSNTETFNCESDGCIIYEVIAWMEKPDPYRPERSEE